MFKTNDIGLRIIISLVLIAGSLYLPVPVLSQQELNIQNLVVNGNFEQGFQERGVAYGWGGFSNGQAGVGWNADTWAKVVPAGQTSAQMIEIKDALEQNRYAGIYQTVSVVPGQQYKLTLKGLIRSAEGSIEASDYGYRLQYGINHNDSTAWELIGDQDWQELPWNEQPLFDPSDGAYRFDTFEATITARSDKLTLFIRGWKKWINSGSGIYDLQEISLVGPAPEGFVATSSVEAALVDNPTSQAAAGEFTGPTIAGNSETTASEQPQAQTTPQTENQSEANEPSVGQPEAESPSDSQAPAGDQSQTEAPLPVSGKGQNNSIYVVIISLALLLVLFAGAITATIRRRRLPE
jgi:hypothetical protein